MRARLCLYDPFPTKASIKINFTSFRFRLVISERQREDCDMKRRIVREIDRVNSICDQEHLFPCSFSITVDSEMKTATTSAFTVSFTLLILCKKSTWFLFQCMDEKGWLECRWNAQFCFVYEEKDSMRADFRKFSNKRLC